MSELAVIGKASLAHTQAMEFNREELELIKTTICKGASDGELKLFVNTCKSLGLNPFARQIFAVKRWDSKERREVMSIQVSIDGFRLVAERTGQYGGQLGPYYSKGEVARNEKTGLHEIVWYDGWPFEEAPTLAKIGVIRKDFVEPLWAQAKFSSYCQTNKEGKPTVMWEKMPEIMLAKCAESLALRKAFPNELSGVYSSDEMSQANKDKANRPVHVDKFERLEKMLAAFGQLWTKQVGQPASGIRYLLEDLCGGKDIEEFDETDIKALQCLYGELLSGKKTWEQIMPKPQASPEFLPAEDKQTEDIDAMFTDPTEEKDLQNL